MRKGDKQVVGWGWVKSLLLALGLLWTALQSAAFAQSIDIPPVRTSIDQNGVDLYLGKFNTRTTDLSIGKGADALALTRYWVGGGWRNTFTGGISANGNTAGATYTVTVGGSSDSFTLATVMPTMTWTNQQGDGATLTYDGTTEYTYTNPAGVQMNFVSKPSSASTRPFGSNVAFLDYIVYPDGRRVDYGYSIVDYCDDYPTCTGGHRQAWRLQSVRNSSGYMIHFTYFRNDIPDSTFLQAFFALSSAATINLKTTYCDPTAFSCTGLATVTYGLSSQYTINSVTDPVSRTWSYSLDSTTGFLTGLRNPLSSTDDASITYYTTGGVHTYATAYGTWTYSYSTSGSVQTTTVTDPQSHTQTYTFDTTSQRMLTHQNALSKTWTYTYDTLGRLTDSAAPELNHTSYHYDSYGNVDTITSYPKSGAGSIVSSKVFGNCPGVPCSSPTQSFDPEGNETDYTYYSNGQIQTVTLPCPATCAGGADVHPQTRYYYTGYQASYIQSSGGSPTPSFYTSSLLSKVSVCRTGTSCSGTSDETIAVLTYGPSQNNAPTILSEGSGNGTLTETTTYAYDTYGNRISVDGPLAGTADTVVYSFDAARNPLGAIGPAPGSPGSVLHRAVHYTYNGNGWLTTTEVGTVSSYTTPLSSLTVLARSTVAFNNLGWKTRSSIIDLSSGAPINSASSVMTGQVKRFAPQFA